MANLGNTIINGALRVNGKINSSDVISAPSFVGALTGNADTATKLKTARTINGTSFDGSGNITTANWGTARNIGIVNSDGTGTAVTVSVNGSGNINLKLPATIKAALTGNAATATNATNTGITNTNPTSGTWYYPTWVTGKSGNLGHKVNNGYQYYTLEGTTSAAGTAILKLGNGTATGNAGNKYGELRIFNQNTGYTSVVGTSSTSNYTITLPAANGTVSLNGHTHNYLPLNGGNMTGNINFLNGNNMGIYWKENGYGDKFKICPAFSGSNDENLLKIQGAVGDAGTDPSLYDLVTISGKSGNVKIKGNVQASTFTGNLNGNASSVGGKTMDLSTTNTTDTWIPVVSGNKLQHTQRVFATGKVYTNYNNGQDRIPTLSFLTFWNGAYNSSNNSNLTYAHQGIIQCKPKTLYDNSSGTTGTVTLSETAANFNYLELYYCDNNNRQHRSVRIANPNNKIVTLDTAEAYDKDKNIYVRTTNYTISNKSITVRAYMYMNFWQFSGGEDCGVDVEKSNYIKIVKVLGYK